MFGENWVKTTQVERVNIVIFSKFQLFKGHNSGVCGVIWLVIKLGRDIMPTKIVTKFDDDTIKTFLVREWTSLISQNFNFSRAITPECVGRSHWLSNLTEILCPQTLSKSLMKIR